MRGPGRRDRPPAEVVSRAGLRRGERVLAASDTADGRWLLGTRDALYVVPAAPGAERTRIPWQDVETADWDRDSNRFRVVEVGEYGRPRPVHAFELTGPGRLLQLVRERVTASVLVQRRVEVAGRKGLVVLARRAPGGGHVTWSYRFDAGVDPQDPGVMAAAEAGLRAASEELGM